MSPNSRNRMAVVFTALSFVCGSLALLALGYVFTHMFVATPMRNVAEAACLPLWVVGFVMAVVAAFLVSSGHVVLRAANTLILMVFAVLTLILLWAIHFGPPESGVLWPPAPVAQSA